MVHVEAERGEEGEGLGGDQGAGGGVLGVHHPAPVDGRLYFLK